MSESFYNPYQFIPVNTRHAKQLTKWSPPKDPSYPLAREANQWVRHDYWHAQGLSGRIICRLTTLSPTIVGGQQDRESQDQQPALVTPYRHPKGQIAIPANSLRGLIGNTAEILSQSSLRVLTEVPKGGYSNRKKAEQALPNKGVVCENRRFIRDKATKTLIPLKAEAITILENMMRSLVENEPPAKRLQKRRDILRKWNQTPSERGWTLNRNNVFDPLVLDGDQVFYHVEQGEVVELSYSSIWRKAVAGDLFAAFKRAGGDNSLPWHKERKALTPVEALFGVVEDQPDKQQGGRHLASRVRFTDALPLQPVTLGAAVVLKILNSPKPPSPAMYFSGQGYVAKTALDLNTDAPNGRKVYLPHPDALRSKPINHWQTNEPSENAHMKLKVRPIPPQTSFEFTVQFENLSRPELGLLLKALQPLADNQQFVHRLGLGKPLGLGHVTIEPQLALIERAKRYEFAHWVQARYLPKSVGDYQDHGLIVDTALRRFLQLSNPQTIGTTPVCYPYVTDYKKSKVQQEAYEETDGFEWFGRNETTNKSERLNRQALSTRALAFLKS